MTDYPPSIAEVGHIAPVPRRIRAMLAGRWVLDTTEALYVWEQPHYPQYLIPERDTDTDALPPGVFSQHEREGYLRIDWSAPDSWFEEDEHVFVHPRNPYTRVDALRSSRAVRLELDGLVLAESSAPVIVFETGLRPRYYLDRSTIDFGHLRPSDTITECPYKGTTSGYWSVETPNGRHEDLAWTYDFPTRQLLPVAGLIAFYDEKLELFIEGARAPAR